MQAIQVEPVSLMLHVRFLCAFSGNLILAPQACSTALMLFTLFVCKLGIYYAVDAM